MCVSIFNCLYECSSTGVSVRLEKSIVGVCISVCSETSAWKRAPWHKTCTWILAALGKMMRGEGCQTLSLHIQGTNKKQLQKSVHNSSCIATLNCQIAVMSVPYIIPIIRSLCRNHAIWSWKLTSKLSGTFVPCWIVPCNLLQRCFKVINQREKFMRIHWRSIRKKKMCPCRMGQGRWIMKQYPQRSLASEKLNSMYFTPSLFWTESSLIQLKGYFEVWDKAAPKVCFKLYQSKYLCLVVGSLPLTIVAVKS